MAHSYTPTRPLTRRCCYCCRRRRCCAGPAWRASRSSRPCGPARSAAGRAGSPGAVPVTSGRPVRAAWARSSSTATTGCPAAWSMDAAMTARYPERQCTQISPGGTSPRRPGRSGSGMCSAPSMWPSAHSSLRRTSRTVTGRWWRTAAKSAKLATGKRRQRLAARPVLRAGRSPRRPAGRCRSGPGPAGRRRPARGVSPSRVSGVRPRNQPAEVGGEVCCRARS